MFDATSQLINQSYVASYNTPIFYSTYVLTGYKEKGRPDYYHARRHFLLKNALSKEKVNFNVE